MEENILKLLENSKEILVKLDQIAQKQNEIISMRQSSFAVNIDPLNVFLILLILFFIIKYFVPAKKYLSRIKNDFPDSLPTNRNITTGFQKNLCANIEYVLNNQCSREDISKLTNAIEQNTALPDISDLFRIEYTIEKNDSATAKITVFAIIKRNDDFVSRSKEWLCDFDFLPDELNRAYLSSPDKKVRVEIYNRKEKE